MWAVVVAGGSGSRFGGPKQFDLLAGRPVAAWALAAARTVSDGVVLVVPAPPPAEGSGGWDADAVVEGGPTRAESVRRGLGSVPDAADIVVVHDAARPLASASLFAAVVAPLVEDPDLDGVVCALAVADTLKRIGRDGITVEATVDRAGLVAVQTPQAFRAAALRRAHAQGDDATDDAALVERAGGTVRVVAGEARNVKLTVPDDLAFAEQLLAAGAASEDRV